MGYVIIVHDNGNMSGWYKAVDGSSCSYTPNLRNAERFTSMDQAQSQCCGNETAHSVESQLQPM
jgi:hypothetical protein